ncbi:MAG: DUF2085 domain-containing protein [Acidobacteria bacterium]|nr:DUF2085 domain-containing protein [Acidobacteriota bacterium]
MTPLTIVLGAAAVMWPVALGAALADRVGHAPSVASSVVYLAASRVCHQRADRSFHTRGQQWPVCARCAGLYLAAPVGVALAAGVRRRGRAPLARAVVAAAVPLAATWLAETVAGVPVPAWARFVTALPLGVVVAGVLVMLDGTGRSNRID